LIKKKRDLVSSRRTNRITRNYQKYVSFSYFSDGCSFKFKNKNGKSLVFVKWICKVRKLLGHLDVKIKKTKKEQRELVVGCVPANREDY